MVRLLSSLNSPVIQPNIGSVPVTLPTSENVAASSGCSSFAHWVILDCFERTCFNPNLVGPAVPEKEAEPVKYNINDKFDRPPFCAMSKVVQLNRKEEPMKDRHSNIKYISEICEEGRANLEWLQKTNLPISRIHWNGWMHSFLYTKRKMNLHVFQ